MKNIKIEKLHLFVGIVIVVIAFGLGRLSMPSSKEVDMHANESYAGHDHSLLDKNTASISMLSHNFNHNASLI